MSTRVETVGGRWSWVALTIGAPLIVSCALHDVDIDPGPPLELPPRFSAEGGAVAGSDRWWTDFADAGLDQAVEAALTGNLDLKVAWARVDQMRAVVQQIRAGGLPQVEASAGAGYSYGVSNNPITGQSSTGGQANYSISVAAGFELDLWGRVAALDSAAAVDQLATRHNLEAIAVSLTASVVETWFLLAEQRATLGLIEEQIATSETQLDIIESRFGQGMSTALDVRQQRQQIAALRARMPLIRAAVTTLSTTLAVLSGVAPEPGKLELPEAALPQPPPLPAIGLPADLLLKRPDVRAAKFGVISADHRVAAAIADQLPSLRLSGSFGFQDTSLETLFTSWIFNLVGNLVAPLFDGGRRSAEVDRSRAAVEERVWTFGKALLNAFKEVEDALVRERRQAEHLAALEVQISEARQTLDEARRRYAQGLIDYLPVLTALAGTHQAEQQKLSAQRQLLSYRVQLHRALGGTWTRELQRPARAEEEAP